LSAEDTAADLAARWDLRKRVRSWGGECPVCSYHGAFSMKLGKGRQPNLYCSNGCTREQLDEAAVNVLGKTWTPPPPTDAEKVTQARAAKQAAALRLWSGSDPCRGTPAALYFASRGLPDLAGSPVLRYRGDCWHAERSSHPALIARVQDAMGQTLGVHRTYLTRDGDKAAVDPVKSSLGPIWTGAIRLHEAGDELVIGEGIETAASAGLLLGLPAWAAISAGNMAAAMVLPVDTRTITHAADPDPPGMKAAREAAVRWRAEGRTVRIATPDRTGQDFNDLLRERAVA
jgi:putative DNA primase/helicase